MSFFKKKLGYIANRIKIEEVPTSYDSIEVETFSKPFAFNELYMPLTDSYSLKKYGDRTTRMLRMFVPLKLWYGKIHVGDRAYLIDEDTNTYDLGNMIFNDNKYCNEANYKVVSVEVQHIKLKVEFEKIKEN